MGLTRLWQRRYKEAGEHYDRWLDLRPADLYLIYDKANWLTYTGHPDDGLAMIDEVKHHDPFPPSYVHEVKGFALFQLGRYADALASFNTVSTDHYWHHAWLAATHARLGNFNEARREVARFLTIKPGADLASTRDFLGFETPAMCADFLDGLKMAGVPELR
jgi:adenylate cyclase